MKFYFLAILNLFGFKVDSQTISNPREYQKLVLNMGYTPLEKGFGLSSKIQYNFLNMMATHLIIGNGNSNPEEKRLYNVKRQETYFSLGILFKRKDFKRNKRKKFILNTGIYYVHGVGTEYANYLFEGRDFEDFIGINRFKQKYTFDQFLLPVGLTFFFAKKINFEFRMTLIGYGSRHDKGNQFFNSVGLPYMGYQSISAGFGYQLWESKTK